MQKISDDFLKIEDGKSSHLITGLSSAASLQSTQMA
tara:strand:- start:56762 stop:56869 length:108 start_codon:yes stop_codon:yes gene_type:complete